MMTRSPSKEQQNLGTAIAALDEIAALAALAWYSSRASDGELLDITWEREAPAIFHRINRIATEASLKQME